MTSSYPSVQFAVSAVKRFVVTLFCVFFLYGGIDHALVDCLKHFHPDHDHQTTASVEMANPSDTEPSIHCPRLEEPFPALSQFGSRVTWQSYSEIYSARGNIHFTIGPKLYSSQGRGDLLADVPKSAHPFDSSAFLFLSVLRI